MEQRNTFSTKTEETKKRSGSERTLWARFYQYVKPYRKNLVIGAFAIVGTALTGLITPYLHMIAINRYRHTPERKPAMPHIWRLSSGGFHCLS